MCVCVCNVYEYVSLLPLRIALYMRIVNKIKLRRRFSHIKYLQAHFSFDVFQYTRLLFPEVVSILHISLAIKPLICSDIRLRVLHLKENRSLPLSTTSMKYEEASWGDSMGDFSLLLKRDSCRENLC